MLMVFYNSLMCSTFAVLFVFFIFLFSIVSICSSFFFFTAPATTEIYTYYTLFPYTTLFRSRHVHAFRKSRAGLRRLRSRRMIPRVTATIDLGCIQHNLTVVRGLAPRSRVMAAVKADAYGHGAVPVARALEAAGVDALAVACQIGRAHV